MTTPQERLALLKDAFDKADDRLTQDRKGATAAQRKLLNAHVDLLEELFLDAMAAALDANTKAVETAYDSAKKAQEAVDEAYTKAKAIPEKIRLVGKLIYSAGELVKKARGPQG